jgi:hypothetical protein
VAAVTLDATVSPLIRSEDGDLAAYQSLDFDDQVSFLRHRFCGVLQRGCDRLWPVGRKACQFALLFDDALPDELVRAVADHYVQWMLNPPVVVFTGSRPAMRRMAGAIEAPLETVLNGSLGNLFALAADDGAWEVSQRKGTWQPEAKG